MRVLSTKERIYRVAAEFRTYQRITRRQSIELATEWVTKHEKLFQPEKAKANA